MVAFKTEWLACTYLPLFACFQVIKAFGSPQFFRIVFPLLFEACKSADSGQAPLGGVAAKTGSYFIVKHVLPFLPIKFSTNLLATFSHFSFIFMLNRLQLQKSLNEFLDPLRKDKINLKNNKWRISSNLLLSLVCIYMAIDLCSSTCLVRLYKF